MAGAVSQLRPVAPGSPPLTNRHSSAPGRQEVLAALRCHLDRLRCGKPVRPGDSAVA